MWLSGRTIEPRLSAALRSSPHSCAQDHAHARDRSVDVEDVAPVPRLAPQRRLHVHPERPPVRDLPDGRQLRLEVRRREAAGVAALHALARRLPRRARDAEPHRVVVEQRQVRRRLGQSPTAPSRTGAAPDALPKRARLHVALQNKFKVRARGAHCGDRRCARGGALGSRKGAHVHPVGGRRVDLEAAKANLLCDGAHKGGIAAQQLIDARRAQVAG
mmetsp:Transcript_22086/g.73269  ORF Transcript_22086/g.73269 Transcript_22086/m.73269 type:complete len:217 (-) Transcript_22086:245-895(-)